MLNTKLKIWLGRNLFGEFGQTESTSAVKIRLMGNNALLFLACLICCCDLRHRGSRPRIRLPRLSFPLVRHDACCLVRDLLRHSCVTRSIWPSARWRRIESQIRVFCGEKNCKQSVECIKTRSFRLFYSYSF